jgi:hypothetical protein
MSQTPASAETTTLLASLDSQRRHVLGILEGLDDDAHLDAARELIDGRTWLVLTE